jgi:uncharacterized protein (TIRG00374 family)
LAVKKKRAWTVKVALTLAFAALVFVGLSLYAGVRETLSALALFKWWVLPAVLALAFGNYLVRFLKWHFYCRCLEIKLKVSDSFLVFMSGLSMSISPGKLGEVLKSFLLKKLNGTPVSYSAPIVVAERLTDLVAVMILAAAGMLTIEFEGVFETARLMLLVCTIAVVVLIVAMSSRGFARAFLGLMKRLPLAGRFADKAAVAFESTAKLITPWNLLIATVVSVVSWGFECAGFVIVLWAFGIHTVSVGAAVFVYCFSTVLGAVSMLPGGLGLTEISMAGMLGRFSGVAEAPAVAVTFVVRACTLWFGTVAGVVFLVASRKRFNVELTALEEMTDE